MSILNKIIIHCSATKEGQDVTAKEIKSWHKKRGWSDIGYHYVIRLNGKIELGRMLNKNGCHTKGHNNSVGICYVGGLDLEGKPKDTRTIEQKISLLLLIEKFKKINNKIKIHGHNQYSKKDCPCFDVNKEYNIKIKKNGGFYFNKLVRVVSWFNGFYKSNSKFNAYYKR